MYQKFSASYQQTNTTLHKPWGVLALLGTLGQQVLASGKRVIFIYSFAYFELVKVVA